MIKTQIGESLTGDLKEGTWTFEMDSDFKLCAGHFAIVPLDKYNRTVPTTTEEKEKFVDNFMSGYGEDTFIKNSNGDIFYESECGTSGLNLKLFFIDLVDELLDNYEVTRKQ